MKKKLISVLLSTAMLSTLFAGMTTMANAEESDTEWEYKEATLTLLMDSDTTQDGLQAVLDLAKEKLGITVEIETRVGGTEGDNIVKTRLASGEMADLCAYNSGSLLSALNPSEYFIDITNEDFASRLDDGYAAAVSVDGATYGIPLCSSYAGAVIYNKAMYEEYGLSVPKTWDEFIANCETLKAAGETAVLGTYSDSWTSQVTFLGDFYNVQAADPTFVTEFEAGNTKYATNEAALSSWKKLAALSDYYNEDYLATTYNDGCDIMADGDAAHWIILTQALSNVYSLYGKETVDNLGVFAVPGDDADNNGLTVWYPTSMYGNKNSGKTEDILRFMEFYVSDEALDAYTSAVLPDGPYCIKGYELPEEVYAGVLDEQAYFDAGLTTPAMEFSTSVKGSNCASICVELASGQTTAEEAAAAYDDDCALQATQLGLNWE